jgi:uncharacterized membrane protein YeaQ/YmgE (transglycosylase-associated protein family)
VSLELVAISITVGQIAGWLARVLVKGGGYGLVWDVLFGLSGSLVVSWIFSALGVSPDAGVFALAVVAFVGAAVVIAAQRKVWPALAAS